MKNNKTDSIQAPKPKAQAPGKMLDPTDLQIRFSISSLLRQAENDIDTLHRNWLLEQGRNGVLSKAIEEKDKRIAELETELKAKPKSK